MPAGIRAEISITDPQTCPVTTVSGRANASVSSVSKSVTPGEPTTVTEELMLETSDETDEATLAALTTETDPDSPLDGPLTEIFSYGSKTVYRFEREWGIGCPCERVEAFGSPVIDIRTNGNELFLTFHAADIGVLQEIIGELRNQYASLNVKRLLQSEQDTAERNLVFVDRSALTARQLEVLETAHKMGYFDHPKQSNAGEVATALDITTSTFTEHLSAAQRKLLEAILDT